MTRVSIGGTSSYDVCVIGSGFGGGVAALRSAEAGASVVVLEQGRRWDKHPDASSFRQTQADLGYLATIFNINVGLDDTGTIASLVLGGRGLGGGSLVYSMVSLRAPSFAFDDPIWPDEVTRAELDPHYLRAERQLGVTQLQWTGDRPADDWKLTSKRDAVFAQACANAGISCDPVPVAINQDCGNLGWCTTGCIRHGKASVDLRYHNPAEALGAQVRINSHVRGIAPAGAGAGRRWRVTYLVGNGQVSDLLQQGTTVEVLADTVIIAGGAVGSPAVLLQSADALPGGISQHCGMNLSRGGDMVIPVVLPDEFGMDDVDMLPGKIIGSCSFEHMFNPPRGFGADWQRFVMQPMNILPVISSILVADPNGITGDGGDMRSFGEGQKHLMSKWGTRLIHVGIMGMDGMDGMVSVNAGIPSVRFGLSDTTRRMFDAARAACRHVFEDSNGGRVLPSWDQLRGDSLAIHPLGTCRMASGPEHGVVDHRCRVFKSGGGVHEGLYVMDASTFSSPIGVNTSLTAAAVAERAMSLMFAG